MRYVGSITLLLVALGFIPSLALAQSSSRWTAKAGVAKYGFEGGVNFQAVSSSGVGFVLELDYRLSSAPGRFATAVVVSSARSDGLQPGITVLGAEAVGYLFRAPAEGLGVNPFVSLGAAVIEYRADAWEQLAASCQPPICSGVSGYRSGWKPALSVGGGVQLWFSGHVGLAGNIRVYQTIGAGEAGNGSANETRVDPSVLLAWRF